LQGLGIGEMTFVARYSLFQMVRIAASFQHLFVVVCFQISSMTRFEMTDQLFTRLSDVSKTPMLIPALETTKL
jgi:hypothetical protein